MLQRRKGCLDGHHIPRRRKPSAEPADCTHASCRRCGHLLVKSPITRKWRAVGMMG